MTYENSFVRELPADPIAENYTRQVLGACYTKIKPTPVRAPQLLAYSSEISELLGYSENEVNSPQFAKIFAGNELEEGMEPYAACYGGHQFGAWAGQLGDGRAISLGQRLIAGGQSLELQLKGAGPTPYSRAADGRAVMRSSVREFLCSEAMFHLGVPTTRALSLVATGESVLRDMFYDGHPQYEPGAIVCRVAPSFVRFGNFELFASRDDLSTLKALADHVIRHHFSELEARGTGRYVALFEEVSRRTAEMVVGWMRVGFVHGVMNTDNMSVLGLTMDYGPYGWVEGFEPTFTPNTTDSAQRRYCFGNQPGIAFWNLVRFANALVPLLSDTDAIQAALEVYPSVLSEQMAAMHAQKLGLENLDLGTSEGEAAPTSDRQLIDDLQQMLTLVETDMTLFYRSLAAVPVSREALAEASDEQLMEPLLNAYYDSDALTEEVIRTTGAWLRRYIKRVLLEGRGTEKRCAQMQRANPKFVPRNYLAQLAIDEAERGDAERLRELLDVLRHPYQEQSHHQEFANRRPEWARDRPGCSMLSCSS